MLRTVSRLPLRRCLHTSPPRARAARPSRVGAVLGVSVVVSTYLVWKTWQGDRIALDSVTSSASPSKQVPLTPKASVSPDALTDSSSTATRHEPSLHNPSPDASASSENTSAAPEDEGESSGGAYNPETGEINWDCPCLGGMAHGPCGLQFREAFSCFVFSEKEPKGIECIEKFKAMQDCFREHPDVYGADIMDDDEDEDFAPETADSLGAPQTQTASPSSVVPEPQSAHVKSSHLQSPADS